MSNGSKVDCLFRRVPKLPDGQSGSGCSAAFFLLIYVTSDSLTLTYMAVGGTADRGTFFSSSKTEKKQSVAKLNDDDSLSFI